MNYETIKPYIEKGLISEQAHPEDANVRIFNYTQQCQFSQAWDDVTRQCRGLIMRIDTGKILARPFPKFFNYGEHVSKGWAIPTTKPRVFEKLDGSLGILYMLNGKPWVATRGSFTSDQAVWATKWWRANFGEGELIETYTHLFEIIYPENRIVVSYDFSALVYLSSINIESGETEVIHPTLTFGREMLTADEIEYTDMEALEKMDTPNSEGFVLWYPKENVRMKIKFAEYVRLHRIVTGVSEIAIWECLRDGKGLEAFIDKVPDEFMRWLESVVGRLQAKYLEIGEWAEYEYRKSLDAAGLMQHELTTPLTAEQRKAFALEAQTCKYPSLVFAELDNKPIAPIIWRMLRPHGARPYKVDIDL